MSSSCGLRCCGGYGAPPIAGRSMPSCYSFLCDQLLVWDSGRVIVSVF
jgi:hypothetical protein